MPCHQIVSWNRILDRLSQKDQELLRPHLEYIDLPPRVRLQAKDRPVKYVYFIEHGVASVVLRYRQEIQIGMIGNEGMSGAAAVLGDAGDIPYETRMQLAGHGQRISGAALREAMHASTSLSDAVLLYVHSFLVQLGETALVHATGVIEARLARWLLMADERMEDSELLVTNDALGAILGVQRSGVTLVLQRFEQRGLIDRSRGSVSIANRKGLERLVKGSFVRLAQPQKNSN
jgi:CRP-like cAMP-binding protein